MDRLARAGDVDTIAYVTSPFASAVKTAVAVFSSMVVVLGRLLNAETVHDNKEIVRLRSQVVVFILLMDRTPFIPICFLCMIGQIRLKHSIRVHSA